MIARFLASVTVSALLAQGGFAAVAHAAPATHVVAAAHVVSAAPRFERLTFIRRSTLTKLSSRHTDFVADQSGLEVRPEVRGEREADIHPAADMRSAAFAAASIPIPYGPSLPIVPADPDFFGFAGVTHFDQRTAGTGAYTNTQFSLEPPDQGLCAGNGYVVDVVNNAAAVYSNFGTRLTEPTSLSQFFGLAPEITRPALKRGPFISDPKCYFDRDTQRWFLTELEINVDPVTGAYAGHSSILLAASQSGDPTGAFYVYAFDTTDAANPGCPCFGDQPLLGADAHGVYVSTNEFPLSGNGFNGAQIYAIAKRVLANGGVSPVIHIDAGALPTPDIGGQWYTIQPATASDTSVADRSMNGSEYFMSSLDFFNLNDNRIAVWALTNTRSLDTLQPDVVLQHVVIHSVAYAAPPPARQEPGATPLGTALGAPLELLNTNDDRMNQVVFGGGRLWSGVNSAVRTSSGIAAGIAYFAVAPAFNSAGFLSASVQQQGHVSVAGESVMFPSIGVNAAGKPVMAATLSGPQFDPTAVYITPDGKVHVAGTAGGADDGFTAYKAYKGNGVARWGDYSAAVADADGSIWTASEYIPGGPRTLLANWGTFIGHVQIHP